MRRPIQLFLAASLALPAFAPRAAAQADSVDAYVRGFIRRHAIPGAAVAVVRGARIVKVEGYGIANLELGVPATAHSIFEIGSITKQFTAEAVMQLAEQGRLSLDDSLARWVPEIPDAWRGIRLRHLLTHSSGLPDWEDDTVLSLRREYTPSEFITLIARRPLDFAPGTRVHYTNSAYPLLGLVIARAAGMPYERVVRERLLAPAGMTETRVRHNLEVVPGRASGYVERAGVLWNGEPLRPAILAPNGFLLSSAADMAKWLVALESGALVRRESLAAMTAPTRLADGSNVPVGIAWFLGTAGGHRFLAHNGATAAGFSSVVYRYPDDDLDVVVLMNIDRFDAVNVLATHVASFWLPGVAMAER